MFRVLEEQGGTTLQEVFFEPVGQNPEFSDLAYYTGSSINGIAYRPADNLIYGVLLESPYVLCRIDAEYRLERLAELPLPKSMLFVSGDISPDERYLVLLGYSPDEKGNLLALVDLESPGYETTLLPMARTEPARPVHCADIAFHPTLDLLFGFDHAGGRLITIDIDQRLIDNTRYPVSESIQGNMPTIFFDAFGNLFGVGAAEINFANRNVYRFDVVTGQATLIESLGLERNQDGCSCPFKVKLLNRVSARRGFPCTRLEFTWTLINRTDRMQVGLRLTDTFPAGTRIAALEPLPFPGEIVRGEGGNILDIRGIDLPIGKYEMRFALAIPEGQPLASVFNRAYLENVYLRSLTETETILSDDPETAYIDDPTAFELAPVVVNFPETDGVLCSGDTLWLTSGVPGARSYRWNTGATTQALPVTRPGTYAVTVTTACDTASGRIVVRAEEVEVYLGPDRSIERGQTVELIPDVHSASPVRYYFWEETPGNSLACRTCAKTTARPEKPSRFQLTLENERGCRARDSLLVSVTDFSLYLPTAFSPNDDRTNDLFYPQSRFPYDITRWQIYDRWGTLVFERSGVKSNDPTVAWDGRMQDRPLAPGLYVWQISFRALDGTAQQDAGEVILVR